MKVTIYHNPRCSKSRQTMQLLENQGIQPEVIEYLKTPPDKDTLRSLLKSLDIGPRELMRTNEKEYREANLSDPNLSQEDLLDALIQHPILMQRPIVVVGKKAAIGRPPDSVLAVL